MLFETNFKRHPENTKLRLHYEPYFEGLEVQYLLGYPLVANYLERVLDVMNYAREQYPRLYVVRVDLHFPQCLTNSSYYANNMCLKYLLTNLQRELDRAGNKYSTRIHYIWAREQHLSDKPHYHLMLFLNHDAINWIGDYSPSSQGGYYKENLYHRIVRAWSQALHWPLEQMLGLVHICRSGSTREIYQHALLKQNDYAHWPAVFYAASYLCKAYSKNFAQQVHCFGSSQTRRRY